MAVLQGGCGEAAGVHRVQGGEFDHDGEREQCDEDHSAAASFASFVEVSLSHGGSLSVIGVGLAGVVHKSWNCVEHSLQNNRFFCLGRWHAVRPHSGTRATARWFMVSVPA